MTGRRRTIPDPRTSELVALLSGVKRLGSISESAAELGIPIEYVHAWRRRDPDLARRLVAALDAFVDERCRAIASRVRAGSPLTAACEQEGITRSRLHVWRRKYQRVEREISRARRATRGART